MKSSMLSLALICSLLIAYWAYRGYGQVASNKGLKDDSLVAKLIEAKENPEKINDFGQKELNTAIEHSKERVKTKIDTPNKVKVTSVNKKKPDDYYAATPEDPYGKVKPVSISENKSVAAVFNAIQPATRDKTQLSVMAEPKPFDHEAYIKNPASYNDLSVPARAFRPAQPGKGVKRLRRIGSSARHIVQGESVILQAKTEAGMPVTFTSQDLGKFKNQLTSQTVAADKRGVASVTFYASTGTLYQTDIQAASPVNSGIVRWVLRIKPKIAIQQND